MRDLDGPYTSEECREMRRLILASGIDIPTWVKRTRRSAEFVRPLSAEQADIITLQALAVAAEPEDLGSEGAVQRAQALFDACAADDRQKHLWRQLLEIRHRHYPYSFPTPH